MKHYPTPIRLSALIIGIVFLLTASAALAMSEELVGAVVKTDQGCALSTAGGEYLILGKDLTGLIGKTVAVTGNVEMGTMSKTIRVHSVKVLKNKDIIDPSAPKAGSKTQ
ncbi:MAG: hypothetical protein WAL90_17885 [Desulfobacterales bacterium]